jgi:hypothetical protein
MHLVGVHLMACISQGLGLMGGHLTGLCLMSMHLVGMYLMGVCLTGMHLMGVRLMGMHLTGVYITGMHLTGVYLLGMHLTGVCLMGSLVNLADLLEAFNWIPIGQAPYLAGIADNAEEVNFGRHAAGFLDAVDVEATVATIVVKAIRLRAGGFDPVLCSLGYLCRIHKMFYVENPGNGGKDANYEAKRKRSMQPTAVAYI